MSLEPCPCGKVPTALSAVPNNSVRISVFGNCCKYADMAWSVMGYRQDGETKDAAAIRLWNAAPRAKGEE